MTGQRRLTIVGRMDSFSEQLRAESEPLWSSIFSQPFLREIKDGTLPLEKFRLLPGPRLPLPGGIRPHGGPGPGQGAGRSKAGRALPPRLDPGGEATASRAIGRGRCHHGRHPAGPAARPPTRLMSTTCWPPPPCTAWGPPLRPCCPAPGLTILLKDEVGQSEHPLYGQWTSFYVGRFAPGQRGGLAGLR